MLGLVARLLEAPLAVGDTSIEARDAIVVLGAPLAPGGGLSQVLAERVAAAAALYRGGGGGHVVATGGTTQGAPRSEAAGVPQVGLEVAGEKYFDYHHTDADTLDKVDPQDLADMVAAVAVLAYVVADLPDRVDAPYSCSSTRSIRA